MRKALLIVSLAALLIGALPLFAADFEEEQMSITVQVGWIGISLFEDDGTTPYTAWALGIKSENTPDTMTAAEHIEAKNDGSNGAVDLAIFSDDLGAYGGCTFGTGTNWAPAGAAGADQYQLKCDDGDNTNPPVAFTTCPLAAAPGTQVVNGLAIAATAHLYMLLTTPSSVSDGCEHDLTVTVRATPD